MSELKAFNMPRYAGVLTTHEVYLKSEADKVIAEKDEEIDELKEHIDELQKATDSAWSKVNVMYDELRHQKYKLCLAMALLWLERSENSTDLENELVSRKRCSKWMELAEKFKRKSTAR